MSSLKSKLRKFTFQGKNGKPYILPTLYGIGFLILIVDIFALGYYRDNAPYHTVGLTLIIFGVVAMIHTNTNIQNSKVVLEPSEPVEAGDHLTLFFRLSSENKVPLHNLTVELEKNLEAEPAHALEVLEDVEGSIRVHARQRGVFPIKRVKIQSKGVYGLFRAWSWHETDGEIIVYPKAKRLTPLPEGHAANRQKDAGETAREAPLGEDFQGHKPYVVGQPLQQVDWKAYARGQEMLLKDYKGDGAEAMDLYWEDTRGSTEERLEQLSSWISAMHRAQRPYSLNLPQFVLPRGSGTTHDYAAYRALAAFKET